VHGAHIQGGGLRAQGVAIDPANLLRPGRVVGWQPLARVWWEQEHPVAVAGTEVVGQSYANRLLCCLFQQPAIGSRNRL
jgi:hypothetical protein